MDFEKLGVLYLGRPYDPAAEKTEDKTGNYLLLKTKELTTHAVCVGMTGSGKTGLCVGLLEEAAMDGIPAIVIDPKGDMANLMLAFPDLSPEDFRPWIHEDDARKANLTAEAFAAAEAAKWQKGLAAWGQDGQRIARMRQTTEFSVYTPGSTAGIPLSVLQSFKAPPEVVQNDPELLQEQISGLTVSLLSLIGLNADPVRSREQILLANLLQDCWQKGEDLDLAQLIRLIQNPPMQQIGVMSLDAFYPAKDRLSLALQFNNLLASPSFATWLQGDPLDIDRLLYTTDGKPRLSILSIAHLNDAERMFFVSLLLNQVISWMRSQSGTSSLRALLYMDEIYGFFPPVANPPSKTPLLTLLKQARAYGLGVVLTTQNPVDLDYKGLANTGIWFIGRLQTERDKLRVLEGLEGATQVQGSRFNRSEMERLVAGLGSRVFLLHSIYRNEPVLFETRWCMSYLAGPLTRKQLQRLKQPEAAADRGKIAVVPAAQTVHVAPGPAAVLPAAAAQEAVAAQNQPGLPPGVRVVHAPIRGRLDALVYRPYIIGLVQIGYSDRKYAVFHSEEQIIITAVTKGVFPVDWDQAETLSLGLAHFETEGSDVVSYAELPDAAARSTSYTAWKRDLADWAYRTCRLSLLQAPGTDLVARPDEDEREFRLRIQQKIRERRDQETDQLRRSYTGKMKTLEEKIRRAEHTAERKKEQARQQKMQTAISFGATLLSAFLGKKAVSASSVGKATTTARGASRMLRENSDASRSQETVEVYQAQLKSLEEAFEAEAEALAARLDPLNQELTEHIIQPYKKDIQVRDLVFAWMPYRKTTDGSWEKAWG